VPIRILIENERAFTPEDALLLIDVFEDTLAALNLANREDPLTTVVAERIIELAKEGERDPKRLRERTLATL